MGVSAFTSDLLFTWTLERLLMKMLNDGRVQYLKSFPRLCVTQRLTELSTEESAAPLGPGSLNARLSPTCADLVSQTFCTEGVPQPHPASSLCPGTRQGFSPSRS